MKNHIAINCAVLYFREGVARLSPDRKLQNHHAFDDSAYDSPGQPEKAEHMNFIDSTLPSNKTRDTRNINRKNQNALFRCLELERHIAFNSLHGCNPSFRPKN
eukprot:GHVO01039591.1.p1 GENE.GHVO01039591.1~~GHVO01039591.1.p1  ORF type:complete len:103 (-),score=4.40 GHVO01039591.1:279-587(-)